MNESLSFDFRVISRGWRPRRGRGSQLVTSRLPCSPRVLPGSPRIQLSGQLVARTLTHSKSVSVLILRSVVIGGNGSEGARARGQPSGTTPGRMRGTPQAPTVKAVIILHGAYVAERCTPFFFMRPCVFALFLCVRIEEGKFASYVGSLLLCCC